MRALLEPSLAGKGKGKHVWHWHGEVGKEGGACWDLVGGGTEGGGGASQPSPSGFCLLVDEGLGGGLPVDELLAGEPQGDLALGGLGRVGAVDDCVADVR